LRELTPDEKKLAAKAKRWRQAPWEFGREILGIQSFDPVQIQILQAYANPEIERIAVKASTGTGKSFVDAVMVLHFLVCYVDEQNHPKGILTSIDGPNMEANLWAEINRLYNGSEFLKHFFVMQSSKIFYKEFPMSYFVERRTWDKKADSTPHQDALGLAGHHAKYSLFLVDESGGVPMGVIGAGERTLVNKVPGSFRKLIQTGNPTHREGPLWEAFHPPLGVINRWACFSMTGDPDDPNRSTLIDEKWCRDLIDTYGRDYPYVQVYVLGEFPSQDFTSFLGIEDCEQAFLRDYDLSHYGEIAGRLGIDIAYEGEDKSFMFPRQGIKAFEPSEIKVPLGSGQFGFESAQLIIPRMKLLDLEDIYIDATGGYAYATMESLKREGWTAVGLKFNSKPSNEAFYNLRTEMYWNMSRWVKKGGALPNIPGLAEELCATRYTMHKDKMLAEDKKIVKKRIKKSPDLADSFVCTFATPDRASKKMAQHPVTNSGNVQIEGLGNRSILDGYMRPPNQRRK
jgi:hypothetical protein